VTFTLLCPHNFVTCLTQALYIESSICLLDFKLSPCCSNDELSSGYLKADVLEHCVNAIAVNKYISISKSTAKWETYKIFKEDGLLVCV
jgi:hypothetical protein